MFYFGFQKTKTTFLYKEHIKYISQLPSIWYANYWTTIKIFNINQILTKTSFPDIRKLPEDKDVDSLGFFPTIQETIYGYVLHLKTKYYSTNLYLVPFQEDISRFPLELQEHIECVLIYFDSGVRSFSKRIPTYANYLKSHDIEMGILLCDTLYEDSNEGITYKEAKQESRFLDVIELGRKADDDEEEDDPHDPKGYDELHQALRSFIWSNINVEDGEFSSLFSSSINL